MGEIEKSRRVGDVGGQRRLAVGKYDFAVDGGAVGNVTLRGDSIPSGAVILNCYIKVETAADSGGSATIALNAESAGDLRAAAAFNAAPWSSTGTKIGSQSPTTAPITTTAKRNLVATIATAALTAGKFTVVVEYFEFAA